MDDLRFNAQERLHFHELLKGIFADHELALKAGFQDFAEKYLHISRDDVNLVEASNNSSNKESCCDSGVAFVSKGMVSAEGNVILCAVGRSRIRVSGNAIVFAFDGVRISTVKNNAMVYANDDVSVEHVFSGATVYLSDNSRLLGSEHGANVNFHS